MRTEDLLNRTIKGYRLLEILGKGGMSTVFLAQQLDNPQDQVAIKVLIPSEFSTGSELALFQARFLREAQAVHQIHHEHILPVLDYGEEGDSFFYMIMPYISGGTLGHILASSAEPLPLPTIASYLDQLASAIDYSNQQGMVHRDIKPSNVLIDNQGRLYLADFGIVRLFDSTHLALDEAPKTLTTTGKIFGTPAYMAPERFRGEPAEPATDLYSLGILLYQLVTGRVPFEADNALTLGLKHLNETPPPPRALRPDLPEPAEAALLKAIAKQPAERFASASALSTAFAAGLAGEWAEELPTMANVLVASGAAAQAQQSLADAATPIPPDSRLVLGPIAASAGNHAAFALTPTDANPPIGVPRESRFWKHAQLFTLVMLLLVVLASASLFAFAVYKLGNPFAPIPGINVPATSTSAPPTRTGATPTAAHKSTPATASPATSPTAGSSPASSPTAGSSPAPTPTRGTTPVPTPTPVPTQGTTPTPAPAPDGTP